MSPGQLICEWVGPEASVLVITLDRVRCANAYTTAMLLEMDSILSNARRRTVQAAIFTGAGGVFCAGADLTELEERDEKDGVSLMSRDVFDRVANFPWPTFAAINGPAIGGGLELALACDVRLCSPCSSFRFPEVELGLVPAAGGIRRLIAEVGAARAKELVMFGRTLDALTARAWGLVAAVEERPLEAALALSQSLAKRDAMALAAAKLLIREQLGELSGRGGEALTQALLYGRRRGTKPS